MNILKIEVENFKNLKNIEADLNGKSVWVLGKNGAGKSSFIQAVFSSITGKEFPAEPLTLGEEKGKIHLEIGDNEPKYFVDLKFNKTNKKPKLTVTIPGNSIGEKSPRTFLDSIVGNIGFNIVGFIHLLQKEPKKAIEEIKRMCGLDFSQIEADYKEKYEERTFVNRELKQAEVKIKDSTFYDKYNGKERIDTKALQTEKDKYQKLMNEYNLKNGEYQNLQARDKELREQVESLEEQLATTKEKLAHNETEIETHQNEIKNIIAEGKKIDIKKIITDLESSDEINKGIDKAEEYKKDLDIYNSKKQESEDLTKHLMDLAAEKKKLIKESNLPIEDLEFGDDMLYINGLPLTGEQINTAKIIELGWQLGAHLHKELKIMRVDGNALDKDSMKEFLDYAFKNGYQVFIEKVTDSDKDDLQIEIID